MPAFPIREWGEGMGYFGLAEKLVYLFPKRFNENTWRCFTGDQACFLSLNAPATVYQVERRLDLRGDFVWLWQVQSLLRR